MGSVAHSLKIENQNTESIDRTILTVSVFLVGRLLETFNTKNTCYFMPQAPTLALTSSRKDVKKLIYFQILQNADNIFFTQ